MSPLWLLPAAMFGLLAGFLLGAILAAPPHATARQWRDEE